MAAAGDVIVILLAVFCQGVGGMGGGGEKVDEVVRVEVPQVGVVGGGVNLTCHYDLRGPPHLYSLKLYHNDTEFYRYVPTETHRPVDIRPSLTFLAHEVSRSGSGVTVGLTALTGSATGEYKCEVIAERPSFRTEMHTANMTVLDEALPPPRIHGSRGVYQWGGEVRLRCMVGGPLPHYSPPPTLHWFIGGVQAPIEYVHHESGRTSVTLNMPTSKLYDDGIKEADRERLALERHHSRETTDGDRHRDTRDNRRCNVAEDSRGNPRNEDAEIETKAGHSKGQIYHNRNNIAQDRWNIAQGSENIAQGRENIAQLPENIAQDSENIAQLTKNIAQDREKNAQNRRSTTDPKTRVQVPERRVGGLGEEDEGRVEVLVDCVLRLGGQEVRDRVILAIQDGPSTYLSNYFSAAGVSVGPSLLLFLASLFSSML